MKILGKVPGAPIPRKVVVERGEEKFVFTCQAVLNYDEFDKLVPVPKPQTFRKPGGVATTESPNDPAFVKRLEEYAMKKTNYLVLKSLEATDGLEWESVNMVDPTTWDNYKDELNNAGFTDGEIGFIINQVANVHTVDEARMKEAIERFIPTASQEAEA